MSFILKTFAASIIISFVSWLSGKKIGLAGFLTALPLTSLIALAFSQIQSGDHQQSIQYAKSIFFAIPLSLLFFIPFFLAHKLQLNFWVSYILGISLLGIGYLIHMAVLKYY